MLVLGLGPGLVLGLGIVHGLVLGLGLGLVLGIAPLGRGNDKIIDR